MFLREGSGRSVASHQDSSISGGLCLVLSRHRSPVFALRLLGVELWCLGWPHLLPVLPSLSLSLHQARARPRVAAWSAVVHTSKSLPSILQGKGETSDLQGRSTMVLPGPIQYVMFNKVKCNDDCMELQWPPRQACQALLKTFRPRWEKRRRKGRHSFNSVQHTPCDGCTQ